MEQICTWSNEAQQCVKYIVQIVGQTNILKRQLSASTHMHSPWYTNITPNVFIFVFVAIQGQSKVLYWGGSTGLPSVPSGTVTTHTVTAWSTQTWKMPFLFLGHWQQELIRINVPCPSFRNINCIRKNQDSIFRRRKIYFKPTTFYVINIKGAKDFLKWFFQLSFPILWGDGTFWRQVVVLLIAPGQTMNSRSRNEGSP